MFFLFHDPATTEIYTLSLHDALPICQARSRARAIARSSGRSEADADADAAKDVSRLRVEALIGGRQVLVRSEEHTSELQSHVNLVCRLLLEKKKKNKY